ncbi:BA14K family protein [Rhizobium sp. CG5]|nr:BA14K family protein [Rhizobium sp. CG5]
MGLTCVLPQSVLAAMPVAPSVSAPSAASDIVDVRVVCDRSGCYDRPGYRPPPPRPIYRPPPPIYYPPPIYRPPPPPPIYYPPPVYRPAYRPPSGGWSSHVRWCLERYRSYNPQTNQYLAYDGYYKACRSPYR